MATFSSLCWELKHQIWGLVREDADEGTKPLACLAAVCRDWQNHMEPLLFKELCVGRDGNDVAMFVQIINNERLNYLQKLTITYYWPFSKIGWARARCLDNLKATAKRIRQVIIALNKVESGQKPHLEVEFKMLQHPESNNERWISRYYFYPSMWQDAELSSRTKKHQRPQYCDYLSSLDGWAKSLPRVAVVTGIHFQPDFLPFKAMDGFIGRFPNLNNITVEFLFRLRNKESWVHAKGQ
ncbi:hypothetical protein VM1G_08794 [Cytospora mali]|uniref:Uncharacterized protein n=1 Tax=Cytospora mali TaxID=578113 RepID=A0A194WA93_CYTMA|nr:hypothetical protein VM1G_08794 [Valsa mali]